MNDFDGWVSRVGDVEATSLLCLNWRCNGIHDAKTVTSRTGDLLRAIVDALTTGTPLFINCDMVTHIVDDALFPVETALQKRKIVMVFYNASQALAAKLGQNNLEVAWKQTDDRHTVVWSQTRYPLNKPAATITRIAKAEEKFVIDHIKKCFRPHTPPFRLDSTPLIANGTFDAGRIIQAPPLFARTITYLSTKFLTWADLAKLPIVYDLKLIAVSMRASPFALALQSLTEVGSSVEVVEHFGPLARFLNPVDNNLAGRARAYVYIGDFLVGGTELKLAEFYCRSNGANLCAACVLGSALPPSDYKRDFPILALTNLRKLQPKFKAGFFDI
jgi:hypothetical protein